MSKKNQVEKTTKKKLTKKELKALNHAKLMANKKTFGPTEESDFKKAA
jgi:hypothetical protein